MPRPTASTPLSGPARTPTSPAASSAARPTSIRWSSWTQHGTRDRGSTRGSARPLLPRDPARERVPLAVRPLRLADPRPRDAVAVHRRAEAGADLAVDLGDRPRRPAGAP